MNDDALAPVIAVMLILAIGVTVFSVYTSTYLPGLKQQAEVEHLKEVESGFMRFSSDIDNAVATEKPNIAYSEQIPLGGGDIVLNSLKSSGTIRIQNESLGTLIIQNVTIPLYSVNYSYDPDGNFWIDQGYTWHYGYVNITKGTRSTPLQYNSADDPGLETDINNFAGRFVIPDTIQSTNRTLKILQIVTGTNNITSSNGIARLSLTTRDATSDYVNPGSNPVHNAGITFIPLTGDSFQNKINTVINGIDFGPENNITLQIIEIKVEVN